MTDLEMELAIVALQKKVEFHITNSNETIETMENHLLLHQKLANETMENHLLLHQKLTKEIYKLQSLLEKCKIE